MNADGLDPVDPGRFRTAFGRFATGVSVVTCLVDGSDHAMTANSLTSVSLAPPLVLVCVERETRFHEAILTAGHWGVSVLGAQARALPPGLPRVVGRWPGSWIPLRTIAVR